MGSNGSKPERYVQKSGCRNTERKLKGNEIKNDISKKQILLEEQKIEYEQKYKKLEQDYNKLQTEFLELKAKYDEDIMNAGDFASHTNEINKKLEDALYEREVKPTEDIILGAEPFENSKNIIKDVAKTCGEESSNEKIEQMQRELDKLLSENAHKEHEIEDLKKELNLVKLKSDEEKSTLKEEFTTRGLLLCERYEEEKKELNSIWEDKLTEVINNCNQDITTFRTKLNKEKTALEKRLGLAMSELTALEKKNKLLNHLFEDIRSRYDSRESKTEDLERIADLEGQLILQAEELEKQKEILKHMKCGSSNNSESASGFGRRSKKNAKKRKKQIQVISTQESGGD